MTLQSHIGPYYEWTIIPNFSIKCWHFIIYWNWVFLIKIFFSANSAHYCTTCLNHCSLFLVLPKPWCSWSQGNFLFEPSGSASHLSQWASPHRFYWNIKNENFNRPIQLSKINLSSCLFCKGPFKQGWWKLTQNNLYHVPILEILSDH